MTRKYPSLLLVLTIAGVLFFQHCATLTQTSQQRIPVTSYPAGAVVTVNGVAQGAAPLEIRLPRRGKDHVIRIESPGYDPVEIRLRRKFSPAVPLGNFVLGLVPGAVPAIAWLGDSHTKLEHKEGLIMSIWALSAVALGGIFTLTDIGQGRYILEPNVITVTLKKADGPPQVDTIHIETDNLRNITWIRIRRD